MRKGERVSCGEEGGKGNGEREVEREDGAKTRWCSRARREVEKKEKKKRK